MKKVVLSFVNKTSGDLEVFMEPSAYTLLVKPNERMKIHVEADDEYTDDEIDLDLDFKTSEIVIFEEVGLNLLIYIADELIYSTKEVYD